MIWPLVAFAAGVPVAVAARRIIQELSVEPATLAWIDRPAPSLQALPWQAAAWREPLCRAFAWSLPLLLLLVALRFDVPDGFVAAVTATALVICCATDLLAYRVPNVVTLPALLVVLVAAGVEGLQPFLECALTASICAVAFGAIALITRGGLGGGDVKLVALIGAALGLPAGPIALAAGIVAGSVMVIVLHATRRLGRDDVFPFAPFLSVAALIVLFV
ncbi:MAG TPA: A24 family peptidase [Dehalococcoidia bacterium]|jgi:prepilin signal peptidase PulO-like enzyme (type II secretory pathway)|nr:A24 family peptidase [Dehalococcoidia bacterium]